MLIAGRRLRKLSWAYVLRFLAARSVLQWEGGIRTEMGEKEEYQMTKEDGVKPADAEWAKKVEVLKLLARGVSFKNIAGQVSYSDKWVRDVRNRALDYPASLIMTLPPEVQDYLAERRPQLRDALDELRRAPGPSAVVHPTAVEQARARHWADLADLAARFLAYWDASIDLPSGGYYGEGWIVDEPHLESIDAHLAAALLCHLKAEFPAMEPISDWRDLLQMGVGGDAIKALVQVAHRRTFTGTCAFCKV